MINLFSRTYILQ